MSYALIVVPSRSVLHHAVAAATGSAATASSTIPMVIGASGHGFFKASCSFTMQFFGPGTAPASH